MAKASSEDNTPAAKKWLDSLPRPDQEILLHSEWGPRLLRAEWAGKEELSLFFAYAKDGLSKSAHDRRIDRYRVNVGIAYGITGEPFTSLIKDIKSFTEACIKIKGYKEQKEHGISTYSAETIRYVLATLGSLYCFKHVNDRRLIYAPKEVRDGVSFVVKEKDRKPKILFSRQEIREIAQHGDILGSAILMTLFESRARIGEFEKMVRKSVKQVEEGAALDIPADKTTGREVIVSECVPYLNAWLDKSPLKGPNDPLWVSPETNEALKAPAIAKRLRVMYARCQAARKKKGAPAMTQGRIFPHTIRKSGASELGGMPGMTEHILNQVMGWTQNSATGRAYIQLNQRQVNRAVAAIYNKEKAEAVKEIKTLWTCSICKATDNPMVKNFCGTCGRPKDSEKLPIKIEQVREEFQEQMDTMRRQMEKMQNAAAHGTVSKAKSRG